MAQATLGSCPGFQTLVFSFKVRPIQSYSTCGIWQAKIFHPKNKSNFYKSSALFLFIHYQNDSLQIKILPCEGVRKAHEANKKLQDSWSSSLRFYKQKIMGLGEKTLWTEAAQGGPEVHSLWVLTYTGVGFLVMWLQLGHLQVPVSNTNELIGSRKTWIQWFLSSVTALYVRVG